MDVILNPENKLRISELFAFVSVDDDGNEGVCAFSTATGDWMPMVGADMARVESLKPIARTLAALEKDTGKKIRLVKFTNRVELETL